MDDRGERLPTLEELYDKYAGALFRHCQRVLGNKADAEDALQETFYNAYRGLRSFRNKYGISSWLYRIATNVCLSTLRRRQRAAKKVREIPHLKEASEQDASRLIAARELLENVVDLLDERDLEIIVSHYIGGMDQGQVAEALGISRRAVAKRLKKMRDRFAQLRL